MSSAEIPSQFTHSIKLDETAKGLRISVHVYANDDVTAITEVLSTYKEIRDLLDDERIPRAPMEIQEKP